MTEMESVLVEALERAYIVFVRRPEERSPAERDATTELILAAIKKAKGAGQ